MNKFTFKVFPAPTGSNRRAFQTAMTNWPKQKKQVEEEQNDKNMVIKEEQQAIPQEPCPPLKKPPVLPPCPPISPMPKPPMAPPCPPIAPILPPCPPIAPMPEFPELPIMQPPIAPGCPGFAPISPYYSTPGCPPFPQIPPQYPTQPGYACPSVRLAHACVPPQTYNVVYSPAEALNKGTLFPELFQPQGIYGPCEGPNPCHMYFSWGGVPYGSN